MALPLGELARERLRGRGACRCGPSCEKAILENPQIFQNCEIKIILPLKMPKAKRRAFPIVLISKKAAAQARAAAFRVILPVQPC